MKKIQEKKILVIEPDKKFERNIKKQLKKYSDEIYFVTKGSEGLRIASLKNPDIVILNLALDDLSGFELCRLIKNNFSARVIVLTNDDRIIPHIRAKQEGADVCLSVPFKGNELKSAIEQLV